MAYSPSEKYPGAVDVDPDYQGGKFRDNNPSTTNNGSPLKAIDRNELLARDEAIMNDAGFKYNGLPDTPQDSQLFKAYKASLGNGTNLLSNHNLLIASPDDSQPAPSATPTSYPPGFQIFSGVFANETTGITNLTYIDGRVSFSGGDFYMPVANTGSIERLTEFAASVADFDGKPRTRGVSFALVGDEYRVTVGVDALEDDGGNPTPLGSVKFEQGSVATGHEALGGVYPLGTQTSAIHYGTDAIFIGYNGEITEISVWEDSSFIDSSHSVSSITKNNFKGFDVITNVGTYEFVSDETRKEREDKQLYGWCDMADLSDITLAIEKALAYNPRLKIETKDGLERELKISFNNTYTPVSGNPYPYGVELPTDTDITSQKNILISTDETSGIMFPIAVGGNYVRPRMKLKGNGSSNNDVNNLLFGIATHIDSSFVMKMYSNIYVDYCEFVSGFNIDVDLRNVSGWKLRGNVHRGSIFSRADGAVAGYQQHVASCDDGERTGNRHYSGGFDRHAFYLATAQSGKNNHCHSHHNFHKWDNTDHTYSPYMSAINCRPTDSLSIDHEIIDGAWGSGISFTTDSGNTFTNLVVDHNQITNIGVKQPENASPITELYGAGISARISVSGGYAFGSIDNNVIILRQSPDDTLCLGIVLNGIDLASNDNVIKLAGDNQYGVGYQLACDGITSHDEKITGNGFDNQSPYLLMGATALTNCLIGPHKTKGFKAGNPTIATNGAFTVPSGTLIDYEISFTITTDGVGGVTYTDTSGSISSVTLASEGVSVVFNAMVKPNELNSQATALTSNIGNIFCLKSSNTVQFVPRDYSGSALNPNSVALSMDVKLTRKGS